MERIRNYALTRYTYHRELPKELRSPIKIGSYLMILWLIRSTIHTIVILTTFGTIAWILYRGLWEHVAPLPW